MKTRFRNSAAFTLIELLVVITIIGILAGIALPALQTAQVSAQQTKALSNARSIVTALRAYAADNDGLFPSTQVDATGTAGAAFATSNQAFRILFPTYLTNEQIFYVPKSKWCSATKPDDRFDSSNSASTQTLKGGENHWAYVQGLSDSSNSSLPLVADGFANASGAITSGAKYSKITTETGGVWQGKIAIIVHVDQSAEKVKPNQTDLQVKRTNANGAASNYFDAGGAADPYWLQAGTNPTSAQVPVNPEAPTGGG